MNSSEFLLIPDDFPPIKTDYSYTYQMEQMMKRSSKSKSPKSFKSRPKIWETPE